MSSSIRVSDMRQDGFPLFIPMVTAWGMHPFEGVMAWSHLSLLGMITGRCSWNSHRCAFFTTWLTLHSSQEACIQNQTHRCFFNSLFFFFKHLYICKAGKENKGDTSISLLHTWLSCSEREDLVMRSLSGHILICLKCHPKNHSKKQPMDFTSGALMIFCIQEPLMDHALEMNRAVMFRVVAWIWLKGPN